MGPPATRRLSSAAHLKLEQETGVKHELVAGEVSAMSGGTADRALAASRLILELGARLRGSPCRPFTSAGKIWLAHADEAVYPDVSVICGPVDRPSLDPNAATHPVLVAEVLSPTTQDRDLGSTARAHHGLPALQHLLLIHADRAQVELQTRAADGTWTPRGFGPGEALPLRALGIDLPVDELSADTEAVGGAAAGG